MRVDIGEGKRKQRGDEEGRNEMERKEEKER